MESQVQRALDQQGLVHVNALVDRCWLFALARATIEKRNMVPKSMSPLCRMHYF